ncbi:MAG: ABC transporter substrate-binding protein [Treponema sp.]|nr:ABC transporter substrate-binding protein [Treponema sp.]
MNEKRLSAAAVVFVVMAVFSVVFIIFALLPSFAERTPIPENHLPPFRIISTAPSSTEIIAGLGLADRLIAVDKYSRDVEGVTQDLPEIDFFYPDIEAVAALKPDIIISGEINTNGSAETPFDFFQRLGIRVLQIPTSSSVGEIYGDIIHIAEALGVTERGEALVRRMEEQIKVIAGRAAEHTAVYAGKRIYFEVAPAPHIVSFGRGTYLNELIEIIGAQNIFAAEVRWFTPSAEAIIHSNPDVILTIADPGLTAGSAAAEIKSRPGFSALAAVRQNKVYAIDANLVSRPSQNIVLALEAIYRAVYSE